MKKILFSMVVLCGLFFSLQSSYALSYSTSSATGSVVTLQSGWNTFSTPKLLDSLTFQSGANGIYFYSLSSSGWSLVTPTSSSILPLNGYLVNNTNTDNVALSLKYRENVSPLEMLFQKQLNIGWNLVGITTVTSPFSSLNSGETMRVDFTNSSDGNLNLQNKVNSTFHNSFTIQPQLFESYALFLQNPLLYAGIQSGAGAGHGSQGELSFISNSGSVYIYGPGTNNSIVYTGMISTSTDTSSPQLSISYSGNTSDISLFSGSYLTVYINGASIGEIHSLTGNTLLNFNNTLSSGESYAIQIRGNISSSAPIGDYGNFSISLNALYDENGAPINIGSNMRQAGNNLKIATAEVAIKNTTITPPSNDKIYGNATSLEIGRFGIETNFEEITVREVTLTNSSATNAVNDFTKLVSGTNVKLVNVNTNAQVSASVTVNAGEIRLTGMNIKVAKDTTSNFKVVVDTQGDLSTTFTGAHNKLMVTVYVPSASSSSLSSIGVSPYTTTKEYTIGVVPPTILLTKKAANVFLVKVSNVDTDTDIVLNSITAQVRPVSVYNSTYSAITCVRDEGSSDKCDFAGLVSGTGAVPGAAKEFTFSSPIAISKNSNVTREIFVDSNYVSPADLQGEVTALKYQTSITGTYSVVAQ